ncbi:MAG: magnesium chelatase [Thermoprotei archaeon]|nr:MAG: magnesium chelatase [Thermoprotei archaeon]
MSDTMSDYKELLEKVFNEVNKVIVGKREVIEKLTIALLANGHVLIEDYPGLAKTLMVKVYSHVLDLKYKRIQFTPDLLPSDITGNYIFDMRKNDFVFRPGPIFANIILADEINRAPPKTQSALLEAMQERQITIEGTRFTLEEPFMVVATQNPIEFEGTYPLPEAQLDRFLIKTKMGYPTEEEEKEILKRRIERKSDDFHVEKILSKEDVLRLRKAVEDVYVDDVIIDYIVDICRRTRYLKEVEVGVSPRATEFLMKASRALAFIRGRDYVIPDDVKYIAVDVLSHRLVLKTEAWVKGEEKENIIKKVLDVVEVPKYK